MTDDGLLQAFVESFPLFNDMVFLPGALDDALLSPELDGGIDDSQWATQRWKPARVVTSPGELLHVYKQIPGPFPPLYERLILSFRWRDVDLAGIMMLTANPGGKGLLSLVARMIADPIIVRVLFPLGFIGFGKASGGSYDPVCFDTNRRQRDGDCPIVLIKHEPILCGERVEEPRVLFPSFRSLVEAVVAASEVRANRRPS